MGATPLWGGAREPKEVAGGWPSKARDQTLATSFGEGGAGGRSAKECGELHSKALQRAALSHDLSESTAITIVPPRGRRERAPASVGKDKAALADTALPSPAYRQEGAHVAAESTAITIVPPKGAKGASASERG